MPPCSRCGSQRIFEFQLTPQFLNYQDLLSLVDWETIVVYTCTSTRCLPDLASNESYLEEFAYIQVSQDFDQVQYGTPEQIEQRRQQRMRESQEEKSVPLTEEEKAEIEQLKQAEEAKAKKKAEKNRKRKERKK